MLLFVAVLFYQRAEWGSRYLFSTYVEWGT